MGVRLKLLRGTITVEQAGEITGLGAGRIQTLAVLGGIPKAYGPFSRIEGSDYRIMIDAADLDAWDKAGRPITTSYRSPTPSERGEAALAGGRSCTAMRAWGHSGAGTAR